MEQIATSEQANIVFLKINEIIASIDAFFLSMGGFRAISFILILISLILFLILIILVCIRGIFASRKETSKPSVQDTSFYFSDTDNENDEQKELERELQFELEMALSERQAEEQQEKQKELEQLQQNSEMALQEQKAKEREAENQKMEEKKFQKEKSNKLEFDWQKGKQPQKSVENIQELSLSYQQNKKELSQLIGLAMDMLSRGVDDLKVAQTINYKNQGMSDENDILKTIDAIKSFINLCVNDEFSKLKDYENLPREDQALFNLANGDATLSLALLENLMDTLIDKSQKASSEVKKQKLYHQVSQLACCFGSLAELNDIMLATSAYELAIELEANNVVAWSSLGDVYKKANSTSKSIWAYQNVINYADGEINIAQIANSNKHISEHLYAEGNSLQAAKLYNSAKEYYDQLGINRRLDKQEIEIIQTIENNHHASLPEMVQKLLGRSNES